MHVPREITRAEMELCAMTMRRRRSTPSAPASTWSKLHCGHGYLLSGFISPLSNQRTDALSAGVWKTACAFHSRCSTRCARIGPSTNPFQYAFPPPTGRRAGSRPKTPSRCGDVQTTRRRHPRCLGRDDIAVGQSGLWPNVSDAVLGNDPQRSRRSDNCGRRHHHGGSNQYHRGRRPCRYCARWPGRI